MKRANFQEPKSEISHSCFSCVNAVIEQAPSGNAGRSRSVAVLGLALSVGASGVLFADSEATAAVESRDYNIGNLRRTPQVALCASQSFGAVFCQWPSFLSHG